MRRVVAALFPLLTLGVFLPSATSQERAPSAETQALGKAWDAAYVKPEFNLEPNAFLTEVVKGLKPGTALDVGMGQGRNAIYLAQRGWTVTGFDPSEVAVRQARDAALKAGVKLNAVVDRSQEFDWGKERWDVVVATYFPGLRQSAPMIVASLRPGGTLVVEAFQTDAALDRSPGPGAGVTFGVNELAALFPTLRVLRYEDVRARTDWGLHDTRLVRLFAQK